MSNVEIKSAQERTRSILHVTVGSERWEPTADELDAITQLFTASADEPTGAIVVTRQDIVAVSDAPELSVERRAVVDLPAGYVLSAETWDKPEENVTKRNNPHATDEQIARIDAVLGNCVVLIHDFFLGYVTRIPRVQAVDTGKRTATVLIAANKQGLTVPAGNFADLEQPFLLNANGSDVLTAEVALGEGFLLVEGTQEGWFVLDNLLQRSTWQDYAAVACQQLKDIPRRADEHLDTMRAAIDAIFESLPPTQAQA